MSGGDEHLLALWLVTLQRLTDRTAHDIRNALNGVAVNLEVVRSRAARGLDGTAVASFAAAAASQFEVLSAQADALITLVRPATGPTDLGALLGRLVALVASAGKGTITLDVPMTSGSVATTADATATRLALSAALLAAMDREGQATCRLSAEGPATVYIVCYDGGPIRLADEVSAAVTEAGISLAPVAQGITISFPSNPRE